MEVESNNFFSTSQGQNACDGTGAVAERAAGRASLRKFCEGAFGNSFNFFTLIYVSDEEKDNKSTKNLGARCAKAKTITNTHKHHWFLTLDKITCIFNFY